MKLILLIPLFLLTGCLTTFDGQMQNRVTTTLACDRAFFASLYGPLGITSEIDKRDLEHLPCAARDKAKAAAAPAPAASAPK